MINGETFATLSGSNHWPSATLNQRAVGSTPTRPTKINHVQLLPLPASLRVGSRTQKMFPPVPLLPGLKSNRLRKNYVGFAGLSGFSGSSGGASDPDNETDQTDQPPSRLSRSSRPSRVTILRRALVRVVAYMLCSQKRENGRSIEQAAVKLTGL